MSSKDTLYSTITFDLCDFCLFICCRSIFKRFVALLLLLIKMADEDAAVSNFREYLRIKSVHPDPDYGTLKASFFLYFFYGNLGKF